MTNLLSQRWGVFVVFTVSLGVSNSTTIGQQIEANRHTAATSEIRAVLPAESAPREQLAIRRLPPLLDDTLFDSSRPISIDKLVLIALDNNKYLRVINFRPALWKTRIDEAASVFDPTIEFGGVYEEENSQLASLLTAAGTSATSQTRQSFEVPPIQNDNLSWSKRLHSGATVQLNYSGAFERLDPAGDFRIVNPAWRSGISAAIEQPLLRGAGRTANLSKINIARQLYSQANHDAQYATNYLVRSIRHAYWDLDLAHRILRILSEATSRAKKTYSDEEKRFTIGATTRAHVAQSQELYHRYRILTLDAKQALTEQERRCRQLAGLKGLDGSRFEPTQVAATDEPALDLEASVAVAMATRPELAAQRSKIEAYRHEVELRYNELLPDWRALGRVSLSGLNDNWSDSVSEMVDGEHPRWMVGMMYRRPVNNLQANALLRRAKLNVAQQQAVLTQLEHDARHELLRAYQSVVAAKERLTLQDERVGAAEQRLEASEKQYANRRLGEVDYLLRAQQTQTDALLGRARAIAAYRKSIDEWYYQRGTILAGERDGS